LDALAPIVADAENQCSLLKRLIEEKFDFLATLGAGINLTSTVALEEAAMVRPDWSFCTLDGLIPLTLDGLYVFMRKPIK